MYLGVEMKVVGLLSIAISKDRVSCEVNRIGATGKNGETVDKDFRSFALLSSRMFLLKQKCRLTYKANGEKPKKEGMADSGKGRLFVERKEHAR